MMSNTEIISAVKSKDIAILVPRGQDSYEPAINPDTGEEEHSRGSLQSHGYDLRMGAVRQKVTDEGWRLLHSEPDSKVTLRPGQTIEIRTLERLALSENIGATIHTMARARRTGLSSISTTVHPKWGTGPDGPQHLEVHVTNLGKYPVDLRNKQTFCRLVFHRLSVPAGLGFPDWSDIREREIGIEQGDRVRLERARRIWGGSLGIVAILLVSGIVLLLQTQWPLAVKYPGLQALINTFSAALLFFLLKYINDRFNVLN